MTAMGIGRRALLRAGAAVALAPQSGLSVACAQKPEASANAGHYRFRIGDIRATVVSDGTLSG
ncbi:MAG: MBL fold metallo-hydrolase, partial [Bradyrhizobium sp.]|nr:MBL fold metallo-hydrolase [Bradyrhizobium sp.]